MQKESIIKFFYLYYIDDDKKWFNVIGPVTDETEIAQKTQKQKDQGKNVRIGRSFESDGSKKMPKLEEVIKKGLPGYKYQPYLKW